MADDTPVANDRGFNDNGDNISNAAAAAAVAALSNTEGQGLPMPSTHLVIESQSQSQPDDQNSTQADGGAVNQPVTSDRGLEVKQPSSSSERRLTRQQIASHSPVMKELIEKFEMRKVDSKNATRKSTRQGEDKGVGLMARDAWCPSRASACLDIDPSAETSSSFSDLSDSKNNSPISKLSLAEYSSDAIADDGGKDYEVVGVANKLRHLENSHSGLSVLAGQGDSADNFTNNKDFDFVLNAASDRAPDSTRGSPVFTRKSLHDARYEGQGHRIDSASGSPTAAARTHFNMEELTHGMSGKQSPQRVSLRGLMKKQAAKGKYDRETDEKAHRSGHLPQNVKQKQTKSMVPAPATFTMSRMPSNMSRKSATGGSSQQALPKSGTVSPTRSQTPSSLAALRDGSILSKNDSTQSSRSKPSVTEESSRTMLLPASRRHGKPESNANTGPKVPKLSSTDRYLMFLKNTTLSPKRNGSQDSMSAATHQTTAHPLTHKPPIRESSMKRQGSNLSSRSKDGDDHEGREKTQQELFKVNVHRSRRSNPTHITNTALRSNRAAGVASKKRPQSDPNKKVSNVSVGISSSGSQGSASRDNILRWSLRKVSSHGLPSAYQRYPIQDHPKAGSMDSAVTVNLPQGSFQTTEHRSTPGLERLPKASVKRTSNFGPPKTSTSPNHRLRSDAKGASFMELEDLKKSASDNAPDGAAAAAATVAATPGEGGGDEVANVTRFHDNDSSFNLLSDMEMADTNLLPKHLRNSRTHHSHQTLVAPRDDCVLFLTSSEEDSSYLSIEDQLKKIKAKRLLQMLQGSTLMDPVGTFQPMQVSTNDANQQTTAATTTVSATMFENAKPTAVESLRGPHLIHEVRASIDRSTFGTAPHAPRGHMNDEQNPLQVALKSKDSSPPPLRFPSIPFDLVSANELEARTGGVVSRPSPLRTPAGSGHRLTRAYRLPGMWAEGKKVPSQESSSPWIEEQDAMGNPMFHFGCVRGGSPKERRRGKTSPGKIVSDVDVMGKTTSPAKSIRFKKRKMDVGKPTRKKKSKKTTEMAAGHQNTMEAHSKEEAKAAKARKKKPPSSPTATKSTKSSPAKDGKQDVELLTPPKLSSKSPKVLVDHPKDRKRSPSSDRRDTTDTVLLEKLMYYHIKMRSLTPVRRLSCQPTERCPIKSRIPLLRVVSEAHADLRGQCEMWAKYRRLKEDFLEPGHPCRIPLSESFRYMLKIAPYQEWKLHRWSSCGDSSSMGSGDEILQSQGDLSMIAVRGTLSRDDMPEELQVLTVATKLRYWKAGPLRMPHLLYLAMGVVAVLLGYLVMWVVTCRGGDFDMFCKDDDISCLVRHIAKSF